MLVIQNDLDHVTVELDHLALVAVAEPAEFTIRVPEGADAEFMTRRAISISPSLWATIPAAERAKLVSKKLWIRENYLRAAGLKKGR